MNSSLPRKTSFLNSQNVMATTYLLLFIFCFASLNSEFSTGQTLLAHYFDLSYPMFMQASTVLKIISLLGFSNVLIGLVYANLDKTMLGLTYSEIVFSSFPLYNLFTVFHILTTVMCVAVSASGIDESSVICFIAVLCGLVYQWVVIVNVVLDSNRCETLAILVWKKRLENVNQYKDILNNLQRLAESFPPNSTKHYQAHLKIFCYAFKKFSSLDNDPKMMIKDNSYVWSKVLKSPNQTINLLITEDVFRELFCFDEHATDHEEKKECFRRIASGYVIQQVAPIRENTTANIDDAFIRVYKRMALTIYNLTFYDSFSYDFSENEFDVRKFTLEYIGANMFVLAYTCMCLKTIEVNKELYEIAPKEYHKSFDNFKYTRETIELLKFVPKSQDDKINVVIDAAKMQLEFYYI